jgi:transaldolase
MKNNSTKAYELGQALWYDNIQRQLVENGSLAEMINSGTIYGVTSNPSIFNNAIAKTNDYDQEMISLVHQGKSPVEIFEALAVEDIQMAADLFTDVYESTLGKDGYVSLEVNPLLANDGNATYQEAKRLWELIARPNLMIKIPATEAAIPAIRRAIADGINVNVTLIFSIERYAEVMEAYLAGLEDRLARGESIDKIASVASFFISRIDSKIDSWLDRIGSATAQALKGKIAIANAKIAYQQFRNVFGRDRFQLLKNKGANLQRPLWASTSTKNPEHSDVLYVNELIGVETVNTVPPTTLDAFNDHGTVALSIEEEIDAAQQVLVDLDQLGLSLAQATQELEVVGVAAFKDAFSDLLQSIENRLEKIEQNKPKNLA